MNDLRWPAARLGEALNALAATSGLDADEVEDPRTAPDDPAAWVAAAADRAGLEAEPVHAGYEDLDGLVRDAAPALLQVPGEPAEFLAVAGRRGRALLLATPAGEVRRVPAQAVRDLLAAPLEASVAASVDPLLERLGGGERVRRSLLADALAGRPVRAGFLLRRPPSSSSRGALARNALTLLIAHVAAYAAFVGAWWLVGAGALSGRMDRGWLLGWGLVLLTIVPLRMVGTAAHGRLAVGLGARLKERLLHGSLRLEPEEVSSEGPGRLLGRVLESAAVEDLAVGAGVSGALAKVELGFALAVLSAGSGGPLHAALLVGWGVVAAHLGRRYLRARRAWTDDRLDLTDSLVENMVGHRTRVAQQAPERLHRGEDEALRGYLARSEAMDAASVRLLVGIPRGWLIVGLLGLGPGFVAGEATTAGLAVGLGGVLLAYGAWVRWVEGAAGAAGAWVAWERVRDLSAASARPVESGRDVATKPAPTGATVLDARDLGFAYPGRSRPVLSGCGLTVRAGERLLLQGPSGGGKSTLVGVLAGLRAPDSGLLLARGLDRRTLGDAGWRRRVVAAPQFHDNHVLGESLAFNLLLGRRWPPRREDLAEAHAVCLDLGLGGLLERMPGGLMQRVGETGWQLSDGETSRVFLARALLQNPDLVVLDESFGALDPDALRRSLACAQDRASSLLVVAHP